MMSELIKLTEAANQYLQMMLKKHQAVGMRISIKKTGCSGYAYAPSMIQTIIPTDVSVNFANGITVFIDPTWQHLLTGITIDYVEEDKSGLKQKKLMFINPNEANRCGCGESFHVE